MAAEAQFAIANNVFTLKFVYVGLDNMCELDMNSLSMYLDNALRNGKNTM